MDILNIPLSAGLTTLLVILALWEMIWKGIGMWKSAQAGQLVWFVVMFVLNTAGILPIIYLLFFQKSSRRKR